MKINSKIANNCKNINNINPLFIKYIKLNNVQINVHFIISNIMNKYNFAHLKKAVRIQLIKIINQFNS